MARTLIRARGLGKKYQLGAHDTIYTTLRDQITGWIRRVPGAANDREFWALRDVSFDLAEGEVVGIIGRNGAGKSTLLKILSRVTEPTEGEATIEGRVASLLEVGVGFHPELSGRENVYLNGAILGMTRAETRKKFDEIVAFSEVERFIDTPVKRYSSGMYVRLAFAVAAHLEPDVLIVDEVLAVGDAAFQKKCLGKMEGVRREGRSIILVSHNMGTVAQLSSKAIWLDKGGVAAVGPTSSVIEQYLSQGTVNTLEWRPERDASNQFSFKSITVTRADSGIVEEAIASDVGIDITFHYAVESSLRPGRLAFYLSRESGQVILASASTDSITAMNRTWRSGLFRLICRIPAFLLSPGRYFLTVSEPGPNEDVIHEGVLSFSVSEQNSLAVRDGRQGVITPLLDWKEVEG